MKKIILLASFIAFSSLPIPIPFGQAVVHACDATTNPPCYPANGVGVNPDTSNGCKGLASLNDVSGYFPKYCTANDLLIRVINLTFVILGLVAVLFIIFGGYQYLTSAGNETKAKAANQTLKYAFIGLAVIILAYSLVAIIANTAIKGLGGTTSPVTPGVSPSGSPGSPPGTPGTPPVSPGTPPGGVSAVNSTISSSTDPSVTSFSYGDGQTVEIIPAIQNTTYTGCSSSSTPPCAIAVSITRNPTNVAGDTTSTLVGTFHPVRDGYEGKVDISTNDYHFAAFGPYSGPVTYDVVTVYTDSVGKEVGRGTSSFVVNVSNGGPGPLGH